MSSWEQYAAWLGGLLLKPLPTSVKAPGIQAWQKDSRVLEPLQWYLALRGENFDGHNFIESAVAKGAAGVLYERGWDPPSTFCAPAIVVRDSLAAIQAIAKGYRSTLTACKVLAVTGSAGKTTTKKMLYEILAAAGKSLNLPGSFNNELGVPLNLLAATPDLRYLPLEFGARREGDIRFLCDLAEPDVVAVLNVGKAHLEIFGSPEVLLQTKTEMFRSGKKDAVAVSPSDDLRILQLAKESGRQLITFGTSEDATVRVLSSPKNCAQSLRLPLSIAGTKVEVELPHFHASYPANMAAAAAMAHAVGIGPATIKKGLEAFVPVSGRYRIIKLGDQTLVDDSYNANPESMRAGLESMNELAGQLEKIVILGDMLELGSECEAEHASLGRFVADTIRPKRLIAVGERSKQLAASARLGGIADVEWYVSELELSEKYGKLADFPASVIFVKASNGIGLHKLVKRLVP